MNEPDNNSGEIGFYGFSDSGKTSLIVKLIESLGKGGFSTAVIKCTDKKISSESFEKDTSRFRAAGAKMTSFSSPSETNFVIPESMTSSQIIRKIRKYLDVDIIIVEGAHDPKILKVRLGDIEERNNTIYTYDGDFDSLMRIILELVNGRKTNV
jgi:molybdopterin-guanine dinucleotide biosynthesis protein B